MRPLASALAPEHLDLFWSRVERGDGCWLWLGPRNQQGYGQQRLAGSAWRAHRLSWELANGPIPDGLFVCHRCDTPACVNPDHLFLGSAQSNNDDMRAKGRHAHGEVHSATMYRVAAKGDRNGARLYPERLARGDKNGSRVHPERMPRGDRNGSRLHPESRPRGEGHPRSKLTTETVIRMRERRAVGISTRAIAKEFGISKATAHWVVSGKGWAHV